MSEANPSSVSGQGANQAVTQTSTPQVPPQAVAPQPAPAQTMTQEQRKFMELLSNLVMSAQELAYALAVIRSHKKFKELEDDEDFMNFISTAESVVRAVWDFHKFIKIRTRGRR